MDSSRHLAAVMFTDIQGYTALMQQDERRAVEMRDAHRRIFNTATESHQGKILQYYGDGTLSIFHSVVDAVRCAIEMQAQFQGDPLVPVRIGIDLGDIIVREDEVIGDAVNRAARIEALAVPGSVLISDRIQRDLQNHQGIKTQSLGTHSLKNVQQPVEVFAIANPGLVVPTLAGQATESQGPRRGRLHNFPKPATRFFGRDKAVEQIKQQLQNHRLVTLRGPGGSGKTRLAVESTRHLAEQFGDGIWFVPLAPLSSADQVEAALAEVLGVNPDQGGEIVRSVAQRIRDKKMLIVLDNCEHLIDDCAQLTNTLLQGTQAPHFLITSREALHLSGEAVYTVPTLPVPETTANLSAIRQSHAVQLFCDRAALTKVDFELNEGNAPVISSICRKLEGIPLALELAASRTRMMDVSSIRDRLSNQLSLLAGGARDLSPHQQTLRATLDWSYQLLSEHEQLLLARLSWFAGSFDLQDAEHICGYAPLSAHEILDLLTHLVDKSLVIIREIPTMHYYLLAPVKQYAQEKLTPAAQQQFTDRYANYYLTMVEKVYRERMEASRKSWQWLQLQLSNVQEAFALLEGSPDKRLRLASALTEPFFLQTYPSTCDKILNTALSQSAAQNADRARVLFGLGFIQILLQSFIEDHDMTEGLRLAQRLEDKQLKLDLYWGYGFLKILMQEWDAAHEILMQGLQLAKEMNNPWMEVRYLNQLGWWAVHQRKPELVEDQVGPNLEKATSLDNIYDLSDANHLVAEVAFLKKQYNQAEKYHAKALEFILPLNSGLQTTVFVFSIAFSVSGQGRHEKGLRLYASCMRNFKDLGLAVPPVDYLHYVLEQTIHPSVAAVGEQRAQELHVEGENMRFEDAIEYALDLERD